MDIGRQLRVIVIEPEPIEPGTIEPEPDRKEAARLGIEEATALEPGTVPSARGELRPDSEGTRRE